MGPTAPATAAAKSMLFGLRRLTRPRSPAATAAARVCAESARTRLVDLLVHLACHGVLRADNPLFSALVLSGGRLTVHELAAPTDAPHRMVLAACESGVGVGYEDNEMLGFVSALFARGTAGLMASTLVVPDVETVDLMRSLHEGVLAGATLAQALHGARADVDCDEPAGFVDWCAWNAYGAA